MAISLVFNQSHCSFVRSLLSMPPTVADSPEVRYVGFLHALLLVEAANPLHLTLWRNGWVQRLLLPS